MLTALTIATTNRSARSIPESSAASVLFHAVAASLLLSLLGMIGGIWADKFDHIAAVTNFIIMPLFAIANTNIRFESGMMEGLKSEMGLGIILGLFLGKPIGITLTSWIMVKLKLGTLPHKANWKHIFGLGLLGGIGFTMSIFIALLSFSDAFIQTEAKFAILIASFISGICGYLFLRSLKSALKEKESEETEEQES